MSAAPTAVPNLVQIRTWGVLGKWVKYNNFLFISFIRELTYRSDPSTDFHAWWFKLRGLAQGCAFWGFRSYCTSPFWGWNSPKNLNFGGVNRLFQAKLAKYCEFHILESTALISKSHTHTHTQGHSASIALSGPLSSSVTVFVFVYISRRSNNGASEQDGCLCISWLNECKIGQIRPARCLCWVNTSVIVIPLSSRLVWHRH